MARQSLRRSSSPRTRLSLKAPDHLAQVCLELPDYSEARYSAIDFFQTRSVATPQRRRRGSPNNSSRETEL